MRFHLVYSGQLPAAGNNPKPADVLRIRRELSGQLHHLWQTHPALRVLIQTGVKWTGPNQTTLMGVNPTPRQMANSFPEEYTDLCGAIRVGDKTYLPLVRESLHLSCELDILFLRQQEPGALISQGGDIDNRIKTLLDALRLPELDEQSRSPPEEAELWCLMQSDTLVSRLDVDTDRLLFPQTDKPHEVHLVIGVKLNVLEVSQYNMCLL